MITLRFEIRTLDATPKEFMTPLFSMCFEKPPTKLNQTIKPASRVDRDDLKKRIRGLVHLKCQALLALGRDNPLRFSMAITFLAKLGRSAPTLSAPAIGLVPVGDRGRRQGSPTVD